MKQIATSFFSLSRVERAGFLFITIILLLLTLIWQTMELWYHPAQPDQAESRRLAAAYESFRSMQIADDHGAAEIEPPVAIHLAPFDPNTLDSTGFLRLGLAPRVVKSLLNWRRHGKHFYKKEDLRPLYGLTTEAYDRLAPFITIAQTENPYLSGSYRRYERLAPLPAFLDLNTTDSATLVRLNGIGPTLAHKIVSRRAALGGFLKHQQLMELYKFSDTTFNYLCKILIIHPENIKKIGLNTSTQEQLQAHPYVGEKIAKNILLLRSGIKRFDNIGQLRQVPLMNEEIYRKIAPYFTID